MKQTACVHMENRLCKRDKDKVELQNNLMWAGKRYVWSLHQIFLSKYFCTKYFYEI